MSLTQRERIQKYMATEKGKLKAREASRRYRDRNKEIIKKRRIISN